MANIQKTLRESTPALRFIGKRYFEVGGHWGEWFVNGRFDQVEQTMGGTDKITAIWENGGGYIGLERHKAGEVHALCGNCRSAIEEAVMTVWQDADGAEWCFENCTCPRYTTPDGEGNIILDYCWVVQYSLESALTLFRVYMLVSEYTYHFTTKRRSS